MLVNMLANRARPAGLAVMILIAGSGTASSGAPIGELWNEPTDLSSRDLYYGPGGRENAPNPGDVYRFKEADTSGHSKGYHVVGPDGRKWKIKVGDEVQSEIAVSRILWAIGYHQPALYYVETWRMTDGPEVKAQPGRFRLNSGHKSGDPWAYDRNPFVGTRELHGLIVANILLNNWDLESGNNRIYEVKSPRGGPSTWYVAQDLGGSLGKSGLPIGTRNRIDDFESQGFIKGVEKDRVAFDYHGPNKSLLKDITRDDVAWTCGLLARLSERQISDAFRAAGYPDDARERYVRKIEDKIRQGTSLASTAGGTR